MLSKCLNILNIILTSYIANQWKTGQIKSPLIGKFVKCAKAENTLEKQYSYRMA